MGRYPEEEPKNILGVTEESSHLTAVESAWSMFCLFKAISDSLSSPWKRAKLLLLSSLKVSCRAQNEKALA